MIVQRTSINFCQIMGFLSVIYVLFVMLWHRSHNHLLDYMAITSITHAATGLHLPQHLSDHPLINGLMNCTVLWLWSNYNCICLQWRLSLFPFCLGLAKSSSGGGQAQTTELCLTGKGTQNYQCPLKLMYHCNFNIQNIDMLVPLRGSSQHTDMLTLAVFVFNRRNV